MPPRRTHAIRRWFIGPLLTIALALAAAGAPGSALAVPIVYTYAGTGTGSIDGEPFSGLAFLIVAQADTDNITPWEPAGFGPQNTHLDTTITLGGGVTATILTPSHTWHSTGAGGGLGENLSANWITIVEDAWIGYGLDTDFGPLVENAPLNVDQFNNVQTTLGVLEFTSIDTVVFQATVIPEPGSLPLVGLGLVALWRLGQRRGRRAG